MIKTIINYRNSFVIGEHMKKILGILTGLALAVPVTFAQTAEPTPMQLVWSIFAVAAIVLLFTIYHLHLEGKSKKR